MSHEEKPATCDVCGRESNEYDYAYTPMQVFLGNDLGWYSGDDGEMCGECMTKALRNQ